MFFEASNVFLEIFFCSKSVVSKSGKKSRMASQQIFFASNLLHLWIQSPIILKLDQLIVHSCGHFRSVGVLLMCSVMILVGIIGSVLPIVIIPF